MVTFPFRLPDRFARPFDLSMREFGPPLIAVYLLADVGAVAGGRLGPRPIGRCFPMGRGRKTAMVRAASRAVPGAVAGAVDVPHRWIAVGPIGLAGAGHQGFYADPHALPGDLFPCRMAGSVVGIGGPAGAIGGMPMAPCAGLIPETVDSCPPILPVAAGACPVAVLVLPLIVPNHSPVDAESVA